MTIFATTIITGRLLIHSVNKQYRLMTLAKPLRKRHISSDGICLNARTCVCVCLLVFVCVCVLGVRGPSGQRHYHQVKIALAVIYLMEASEIQVALYAHQAKC